mmetsp:Transcript_42792/g.79297  ORF Transcript_42792/g.79297 Transcript_42792/m.79297 type:complete len:249 (+) Transcript_42792:135-881(+)
MTSSAWERICGSCQPCRPPEGRRMEGLLPPVPMPALGLGAAKLGSWLGTAPSWLGTSQPAAGRRPGGCLQPGKAPMGPSAPLAGESAWFCSGNMLKGLDGEASARQGASCAGRSGKGAAHPAPGHAPALGTAPSQGGAALFGLGRPGQPAACICCGGASGAGADVPRGARTSASWKSRTRSRPARLEKPSAPRPPSSRDRCFSAICSASRAACCLLMARACSGESWLPKPSKSPIGKAGAAWPAAWPT